MRNKAFRNNIAHEVIIFLMTLALFLFVTRIWPILFLVILGIFIAALRLLFKRTEKVEIIEPTILPPPLRSETEKNILRPAHGLIQQRITAEVHALHPSAHWQWLTPNAMASIERDEPVRIILSGAGGYRKACVNVHNLVFRGLTFETAQTKSLDFPRLDAEDNLDENSGSDDEPEVVNYAFLAFEWADAHLLDLNTRANEALGQRKTTLLISESELPVKESWPDICTQLVNSGFADATVRDDGILVSLQQ